MSAIAIVALLVVIGAGYGVAGYTTASNKLNAANRAIDTTVAHRNAIDEAPATFDLQSSDAKTFKADAAKWMKTWNEQSTTIASDDQSLATAGARLHDQEWLTLLRQASLNNASVRVEHARKALKAAQTIAIDRQAEGKFLTAYANFLNDIETFLTDEQAGDAVSALAAASQLPTDAGQAITLANDPQFPAELKQYLESVQTVAKDLVEYLNAASAGDVAKAKAIQDRTNKDIAAGNLIDVTDVPTKIDEFYQPFMDTYHNELAHAQGR